jgi:hypothetical protein
LRAINWRNKKIFLSLLRLFWSKQPKIKENKIIKCSKMKLKYKNKDHLKNKTLLPSNPNTKRKVHNNNLSMSKVMKK